MRALQAEATGANRARIARHESGQRGLSPDRSVGLERLWDILIPTSWIAVALSLVALLGIGLVTVWGWIAS